MEVRRDSLRSSSSDFGSPMTGLGTSEQGTAGQEEDLILTKQREVLTSI